MRTPLPDDRPAHGRAGVRQRRRLVRRHRAAVWMGGSATSVGQPGPRDVDAPAAALGRLADMETETPVAHAARALDADRQFYTRDGVHVASIAQEAVVRPRAELTANSPRSSAPLIP